MGDKDCLLAHGHYWLYKWQYCQMDREDRQYAMCAGRGILCMQVNGHNLVNVDHSFAVSVLKSAGNDITIVLDRSSHSPERLVRTKTSYHAL